MYFSVKLIQVSYTENEEARQNLQSNCTHVSKNYWLCEGDVEGLHGLIEFKVIGEQAIESYGDLDSEQLKDMVGDYFDVLV